MTGKWPTPAAQQYGGTAAQHLARKNKMQGSARKTVTELNAFLSVWPTPQAHDSVGGKTPAQIAAMRTKGHGVSTLNEAAPSWPTPSARDHNSEMGGGQQQIGRASGRERVCHPV